MSREEQERRRLIRHWSRFMIMHMEGRDHDPPNYTLREALERLRQLIDEELYRLDGDSSEGTTAA